MVRSLVRVFVIFWLPVITIGCAVRPYFPQVGQEFQVAEWNRNYEKTPKLFRSPQSPGRFRLIGKTSEGTVYDSWSIPKTPEGSPLKLPLIYFGRTEDSRQDPRGILVKGGVVTKILTNDEFLQYEKEAEQEKQRAVAVAAEEARLRKMKSDDERYGVTDVGLHLSVINSDAGGLKIYGSVRNNLAQAISDIKITCQHFAQSGTRLLGVSDLVGDNSVVIYQTWNPSEIRSVEFSIQDVEQRYRTVCKVVDWRD